MDIQTPIEITSNKPIIIQVRRSKGEVIWGVFKGIGKIFLTLLIIGMLFSPFAVTKFERDFEDPIQMRYMDWYGKRLPSKDNDVVIFIPIRGMILDTQDSVFSSGQDMVSSRTILQMLDKAEHDPKVKAIVLHIDSPGGTVLDSEKIASKVYAIRKNGDKKIYALMESTAASGGYYIASQAEKIFAYRDTITGSIGVVIEAVNAQKLMSNIGVETIAITSGKMKTMGSPFEPMTDEAKQILQEMVDEAYDEFLDRVSLGRNMPKEQVKKLADGRIYSGLQALKLELIDSIDGSVALKNELEKNNLGYLSLAEYYIAESPFDRFFAPLSARFAWLFPSNKPSGKIMMFYK